MIMRRDDARVAVIGGGIAGLNCAARLMSLGYPVEVFDKGRGPGGRASRRREGIWRFEHGASGAHALVRRLAAGLNIHRRQTVVALLREGDRDWRVVCEDDQGGDPFDFVVVAVPAPQAAELLAPAPGLARITASIRMDPCLTAMVGFTESLGIAPADLTIGIGSVQRAVRQIDDQLPDGHEGWVLHGETQFSRDNLECDLDIVGHYLLGDFARALGRSLPRPSHLRGHRWRYAQANRPLGMDCLFDPILRLGVCGDWCRGTTVDDALVSGRALASRIAAARSQQAFTWRAASGDA